MAQNELQQLVDQVQAWWSDQHAHNDGLAMLYRSPCPWGCNWRNGRSVEQMAYELHLRLKPEAVRASRRLEQPDTQVALQVARSLLPVPVGDELAVVVDVVMLAGAQTVAEQKRAVLGLVGALGSLLLFAIVLGRGLG